MGLGLNLHFRPQPIENVLAMITPTPKQPEVIPAVFYDSQTYLAAGSSTLEFFSNVNADKTLSNMDLAGAFPNPQYFEVQKIFCDFLRADAAAGAATFAGKIRDIDVILGSARGTFTFNMSNKNYVQTPLTFAGSSGGLIGQYVAAAGPLIYGQGTTRDNGGYPVNGSIVIPPQTKFGITLNFNSTAVSADLIMRISLLGQLYRRVV